MKKALLALLAFPLLTFSSQAAVNPVASFESIVKKFETHLKSQPLFVTKLSAAKSSFKKDSFSVHKYLLKDSLEYDVKKTDSLVAPYNGVISFSVQIYTNNLCADLVNEKYSQIRAYSSAQKALETKGKSSCYKADDDALKMNFNFVFQKDKWVLKSLSHEKGYFLELANIYKVESTNTPEPEPTITEAENKEAFQINNKWLDVLK